MSEDLHNIDDLFKKGLEDHNEVPPSSAWENIDKTLDRKRVITLSKRYNALKWAAAVLLLFSLGMAMYTLHVRKKDREIVQQQKESKDSFKQQKAPGINSPGSKDWLKEDSTTEGKNNDVKEIREENNNRPPGINPLNTEAIPGDADKADSIDLTGNAQGHLNVRQSPKNIVDGNVAANNHRKLFLKHKASVTARITSTGLTAEPRENYANKTLQVEMNKKPVRQIDELPVGNYLTGREKNNAVVSIVPEFADVAGPVIFKPGLQMTFVPDSKLVSLLKNSTIKTNNNLFKNNRIPRFSSTVFFSADLVATSLKNENVRYREEDKDEIENEEKSNFSYTIGAMIDYTISRRFWLESGITFSTWITNIKPKTIFARPDNNGNINYRFNCSAGYSFIDVKSSPPPASGDSLEALHSNNTLQYIGVPVALKYRFGNKKFSVAPAIGLSANFLTKGYLQTTIATGNGFVKASFNTIDGLKSTYFSGLVNVAFQYNVNKNLSLAFIPATHFGITSINKNAPVKTNLYSMNFGGGIVFNF